MTGVNASPTSYDETTDIGRFNTLLDAITEKRFLSPTVFTQAVRAACDLHGIVLQHLPIEGVDGISPVDYHQFAKNIKDGVPAWNDPSQTDYSAPPIEDEYIFNIEDSQGNVTDTYLYIVVDRDEEGLYECYAQIVDDDELQDLLTMDEKDFPELIGDSSGETEYLKQTRHSRGEIVDDTPPNE